MRCRELNRLLIKRFPNLKEKYFDEVSWQDGDYTGSHVVYGGVLAPYLVECITNGDTLNAKKVFDFLEEVLSLGEEYSYNVIACSVIEDITYLLLKCNCFQSLLGDLSKKVFENYKKITI
jgi:hypothetical protein